MPANCGRFYGGHQFAVLGGSGTRITSTVPSSQQINFTYPAKGDEFPGGNFTTWRHGAKIITDWSSEYTTWVFPAEFGPPVQAYDGRPDVGMGGNGPIEYEHTDNVNPGATGAALVITSPCTLIQALSRSDAELAADDTRSYLRRRDLLFFLASAPATDSLPPPIGAVPLVSRYTKADIDLSAFPNHSAVSGEQSISDIMGRIRWHSNVEGSARPSWDYYAGYDYENVYASNQAILYGNAALAMCRNHSTETKTLLAAHIITHAQNTVECLNAGARYNYPGGLGGILAGRKLFVVLAYILTGDSYFGDWAIRLDWAAEDTQVRRVDAAAVAAYDYLPEDEGMGDWNAQWDKRPDSISRDLSGKGYLNMFANHIVPQGLSCMMVSGAKAAWNNDALFDFLDRMMERTLYDGSGTDKYFRTAMTAAGQSGTPSAYHKAFWDAHRSDGGMPAIWNWP
jgi:hypothetical protein